MWAVVISNLPEMLVGGVYTYTVFQIGRWSTKRWPTK